MKFELIWFFSRLENERISNKFFGLFNFLDPKEWIKLIGSRGNKPKDWLDFMRYMTANSHYSDEFKHHNYLSDLYETAFDVSEITE